MDIRQLRAERPGLGRVGLQDEYLPKLTQRTRPLASLEHSKALSSRVQEFQPRVHGKSLPLENKRNVKLKSESNELVDRRVPEHSPPQRRKVFAIKSGTRSKPAKSTRTDWSKGKRLPSYHEKVASLERRDQGGKEVYYAGRRGLRGRDGDDGEYLWEKH